MFRHNYRATELTQIPTTMYTCIRRDTMKLLNVPEFAYKEFRNQFGNSS